jgi:hypothetical protein
MLVAMVVNFDAARVTLQRVRRELRVVKLEQNDLGAKTKKEMQQKKKKGRHVFFLKAHTLKIVRTKIIYLMVFILRRSFH